MSDVLSSPIQYAKGVGPKLAKILSKKGISTFEDALYFLPRDYEDRRQLTPLVNLRAGTFAVIFGKVTHVKPQRIGRRHRLEVTLADTTGEIHLFWFHAYAALLDEFELGQNVVAAGDVRQVGRGLQIAHPDFEKVTELKNGNPVISLNFGRVVPIYSETEGLHQKTLRKVMREALVASLPHLRESLPSSLLQELKLPSLRQSFTQIHFPETVPGQEGNDQALQRIIFEEFFILEIGLGLRKQKHQRERAPVLSAGSSQLDAFIESLPFTLTPDQQQVLQVIKKDLSQGQSMCRLVQGDVGSGKTVVTLGAAVLASGSGYQTALMAPTELLAQQHHRTAQAFLKDQGIPILLLTQSQEGKQETLQKLQESENAIVIGTHALFQEGVQFKNLGLVIVDEQHRFGVEQRAQLLRKGPGGTPHLLMTTATPIPRTLALTLYGDLDLSIIRQKPAGRKPIRTRIIRDRQRPQLYKTIEEVVRKGQQVYIIYPLVEESEKMDLKSATEMYQKLSQEVFPHLKVALVHGRLKGEVKDQILAEFKDKKWDILVSTTVIEVGIDVPNATLMVIEHPERLGLSQLHQLRGRVGRGAESSECLLVADQYVTERLRIMTKTEDGFVIAEEDLRIRGPGEFLGTRQSGLPGFRVGNILKDAVLLEKAKEEAEKLLRKDPDLKMPEHGVIRSLVESRWKQKIERLRGG
ncbi:ATP-dependent DNA helicase RecG [bacterium]|nr:ATP-dependent DNA helicase RecG [bacterium]